MYMYIYFKCSCLHTTAWLLYIEAHIVFTVLHAEVHRVFVVKGFEILRVKKKLELGLQIHFDMLF